MDKFKYLTKKQLEEVRNSIVLSERQLKIFNLRFFHSLSLDYIAEKLNASYSTIAHESSIIGKKIDKYLK